MTGNREPSEGASLNSKEVPKPCMRGGLGGNAVYRISSFDPKGLQSLSS